jgi:hypothetical protein
VINLIDLLVSLEQDPVHHDNCIRRLQDKINPDQPILSCACCGERWAKQMEGMNFVQKELSNLNLLKVMQDIKTEYYNIDEENRQAWGIYPQNSRPEDMTELFHLHPQFVTGQTRTNVETGQDESVPLLEHVATICNNCNKALSSNKLPEFSLAKGLDYGDITRIPQYIEKFGTPNIADRMVIGLAIPYSKII